MTAGATLDLVRTLVPLDWSHAGWIASALLRPLQVVLDLLCRAVEVPIVGALLLPLLTALSVGCVILSFVVTALLVFGSNVLVALAPHTASWWADGERLLELARRALVGG